MADTIRQARVALGGVPPGLVRHTAKRDPRLPNGIAIHFQTDGDHTKAKA